MPEEDMHRTNTHTSSRQISLFASFVSPDVQVAGSDTCNAMRERRLEQELFALSYVANLCLYMYVLVCRRLHAVTAVEACAVPALHDVLLVYLREKKPSSRA